MRSEAGVIERNLFIEATPETVFSFLVDPQLLARWIGRSPAEAPRPGGSLRIDFTLGSGRVALGTYTEVSFPRRLAFTFGWEGQDSLPPGTSLVEFDLAPHKGGTILRFRHSGLPEEAPPEASSEQHRERWSFYLARLRDVAAHASSSPPSL
jgi:uncharacterized protein YndB with AHSA1/START domain